MILAGGRATRFGGLPKGLERVRTGRILDAVARALREATDALLLAANAPGSDGWLPGVPTVPDVIPDVGSLGGLHAALASSEGRDVIVVAWDMPFVTATLLRALRERGERGDVDAVLPRGDTGHGGGEPLCAWYAAGCLTTAERLVRGGERRAGALAAAVHTWWLDPSPFGDPARLFMNVNTPDDLANARALDPREP